MHIYLEDITRAVVWKAGMAAEVLRVGIDRGDGTVDVPEKEWERIAVEYRMDPAALANLERQMAGCKGCGDGPLEGI